MKTMSERVFSTTRTVNSAHTDYREAVQKRDLRPGQPWDFIRHLRQLCRQASENGIEVLPVVIYCRVSSDKQRRYGNLDHQSAEVRRYLIKLTKRLGIKIDILDEVHEDVSAWKLWKSGRPELVKAAKLAKKKGGILVALNTSRFVRNRNYQRKRTLPTVDDFEKLKDLVGGVRLATILPPDRQEDRGIDTKRGYKARGAKPGRPKKRTREQRKRLAKWLSSRGWVIREIAAKKMVGASKSTVGRWLNE